MNSRTTDQDIPTFCGTQVLLTIIIIIIVTELLSSNSSARKVTGQRGFCSWKKQEYLFLCIHELWGSRDSVVGIATGYGLDDWGRSSSPGRVKNFLHVQTGSGAHPASYPMGTGGSFPRGVKRQKGEADHSSPTSAEVKKMWIYTFTPPYTFMT
jgi:hypothetical protein